MLSHKLIYRQVIYMDYRKYGTQLPYFAHEMTVLYDVEHFYFRLGNGRRYHDIWKNKSKTSLCCLFRGYLLMLSTARALPLLLSN